MHDTFLIKKISDEVSNLCRMNGFYRLTKLVVTVNQSSHVNEENLLHQLHHTNKKLYGEWTKIQVLRDNIQDQTAILQTIEGEKGT
jgi:Zn finger protein HypA/HybF involved in hydrogenase expression